MGTLIWGRPVIKLKLIGDECPELVTRANTFLEEELALPECFRGCVH